MSGSSAFDEQVAAHYEPWYETPEGQRADALERASLQQILGRLPEAHSVLEVGCGTGHFTRWLDEQGLAAVGLDLSAAMLAEAKREDRIPLVQADARRLPFADNAFDLTAFITTLEFLEAPQEALVEAMRVASRGLLLGILNRWSVLAGRRRLFGLFRPSIYQTARFYGVGELRQLLHRTARDVWDDAQDERGQVIWHTTLFPRWAPWKRAKLPCGGLIVMALLSAERI